MPGQCLQTPGASEDMQWKAARIQEAPLGQLPKRVLPASAQKLEIYPPLQRSGGSPKNLPGLISYNTHVQGVLEQA